MPIVTPMTVTEMNALLNTIQAAPNLEDKLAYFQEINQQIVSNVSDDDHYTLLTLYNACQMFHESPRTPDKRARLMVLLNNKPHQLDTTIMVAILDSFYGAM